MSSHPAATRLPALEAVAEAARLVDAYDYCLIGKADEIDDAFAALSDALTALDATPAPTPAVDDIPTIDVGSAFIAKRPAPADEQHQFCASPKCPGRAEPHLCVGSPEASKSAYLRYGKYADLMQDADYCHDADPKSFKTIRALQRALVAELERCAPPAASTAEVPTPRVPTPAEFVAIVTAVLRSARLRSSATSSPSCARTSRRASRYGRQQSAFARAGTRERASDGR
jgi:hypothetical protein